MSRLADRLASLTGLAVRAGEPLARHTTFKIGGPAELLVDAVSEEALAALLMATREAGLPFHLLGLGSNLLVPDRGLRGVVARLGGELAREEVAGDRVTAGAGLSLARLARRTAKGGLLGLEAFSGFPSTVGGAVWMNAGCYGREIKDVLVSARLVEPDGRRHDIGVAELGAGYRSTALQGGAAVVAHATFQLAAGDASAALAEIDRLNQRRRASLPSGRPNAGSIFKNPPGDYAGRLIEACGLKGATRGGAEISPKHANVIVNRGGALAAEVLELMVLARREVESRFGVALAPEIVLAGELAAAWRAATDAAQPAVATRSSEKLTPSGGR